MGGSFSIPKEQEHNAHRNEFECCTLVLLITVVIHETAAAEIHGTAAADGVLPLLSTGSSSNPSTKDCTHMQANTDRWMDASSGRFGYVGYIKGTDGGCHATVADDHLVLTPKTCWDTVGAHPTFTMPIATREQAAGLQEFMPDKVYIHPRWRSGKDPKYDVVALYFKQGIDVAVPTLASNGPNVIRDRDVVTVLAGGRFLCSNISTAVERSCQDADRSDSIRFAPVSSLPDSWQGASGAALILPDVPKLPNGSYSIHQGYDHMDVLEGIASCSIFSEETRSGVVVSIGAIRPWLDDVCKMIRYFPPELQEKVATFLICSAGWVLAAVLFRCTLNY